MKIDRVVVFCSPNDVSLAEICVASIRHFNKSMPVYLHKDESKRKFDTKHLERAFNVLLCDTSKSSMGSPLSKLFYLIQGADVKQDGERIFVLDADTAWFGDVLKVVENSDANLIVNGEEYSPNWSRKVAFDPVYYSDIYGKIKEPDFVFNTGCIVANTNKFRWGDYEQFLCLQEGGYKLANPKIKLWDQGLINLVTAAKVAKNDIQVENLDFTKWPGHSINFEDIENNPFVVHWAGLTHPVEVQMNYFKRLWPYRLDFIKSKRLWFLSWTYYWLSQAALYVIQKLKNLRLLILGKKQFIR